MKLRIRGDSLRLRLTQGEVAELVERSRVEDATSFGPARLRYVLSADLPAGAPLAARLLTSGSDSCIEVRTASDVARTWAASDTVGMEGTDASLRILVEKDFACLKDRPHEDDADAFPNPAASKTSAC
jgi:hypothetical protein